MQLQAQTPAGMAAHVVHYSFRVIFDKNRNGRWDTGDYDIKRQPEQIFEESIEELRPGWEVEKIIDIEKLGNNDTQHQESGEKIRE